MRFLQNDPVKWSRRAPLKSRAVASASADAKPIVHHNTLGAGGSSATRDDVARSREVEKFFDIMTTPGRVKLS